MQIVTKLRQFEGEVVAVELESLFQIKTMRHVAHVAGVEVQAAATGRFGMGDQPVEQGAAEALRSFGRKRCKIVDVENLSPGEEFGKAKSGYALDFIFMPKRKDPVGLLLLAADLREKIALIEVGAKMTEDRKARLDFLVGICDENFVGHENRPWKAVSG